VKLINSLSVSYKRKLYEIDKLHAYQIIDKNIYAYILIYINYKYLNYIIYIYTHTHTHTHTYSILIFQIFFVLQSHINCK